MKSCIYAIENIVTGKRYIGSAQDYPSRRRNHFILLTAGRHHSAKLQRSFNKHGPEMFAIFPLLICAPKDLLFFEQRAIDAYSASTLGYNINPCAGSNAGRTFSATARAKMSAAKKGKPLPMSGLARIGRIASLEHRQNISNALKGKAKSLEHRAKLAAARRGVKLSEEACRKMSIARIGKKQRPETIAKRLATMKAKLFSGPSSTATATSTVSTTTTP